jgi:hypothetical protein
MRTSSIVMLAGIALCSAAASSFAGPPIMCHQLEIGSAQCLPLGAGPLEAKRGYESKGLVRDTLALLKDESSPLVRMETLRRATVYARADGKLAAELLSRLTARALDAAAGKDPGARAAALFDAGFLAVCYGEMNVEVGYKPGVAEGVQGYAWIRSALESVPAEGGDRAAMEFGAALAVHPAMHTHLKDSGLYEKHLIKAAECAPAESLVRKNVAAHATTWGVDLGC